jgi:hypothetical protein
MSSTDAELDEMLAVQDQIIALLYSGTFSRARERGNQTIVAVT